VLNTTLLEYRKNTGNSANSRNSSIMNSASQFSKLQLLRNELTKMATVYKLPEFSCTDELTPDSFNPAIADSVSKYLDRTYKIFSIISNSASDRKDRFINTAGNDIKLKKLENDYYNYKLLEIVTKPYERKKILVYNNSLVQNIDPVYLDPYMKGFLDFRTHFYAPSKNIFGMKTDTFIFNISIVLLSTVLLYLTLYYELLGRAVRFIENFKFRKYVFNALLICFFILLC
jgi:hypothetical protein